MSKIARAMADVQNIIGSQFLIITDLPLIALLLLIALPQISDMLRFCVFLDGHVRQ
jgi:hypothetical protein